MCPGGDNIVAELGSEMTKNGNIAVILSLESQPASWWTDCPAEITDIQYFKRALVG